jgi:hypothetical protein
MATTGARSPWSDRGPFGPELENTLHSDDVWRGIDDLRRRLVELLEDLSEQEWRQPSLCEGWTVRQVAAHVALQNMTRSEMARSVLAMVRAGGLNGGIREAACRHALLPTERIIAEIRDQIGIWRPLPLGNYRDQRDPPAAHRAPGRPGPPHRSGRGGPRGRCRAMTGRPAAATPCS